MSEKIETNDEAEAFERILAPLRSGQPEPTLVPIQRDNPHLELDELDDPLAPATAEAILEVDDISKTYDEELVLDKISFKLYPGEILGLLGPNGAGKTTTLRILATVIKAASGSARICGHSLSDYRLIRPLIGYMPDILGDYEDLRVDEYMHFFARAYAIKPKERENAIEQALGKVDMSHFRTYPLNELSRGQRQRLALGRVLMHDPKILLLDEPASGLDPKARVELRSLLRELAQAGKTIILSSHILEDIADLCGKIALIDRGRLLLFGSTKELLTRLHQARSWRLRVRQEDSGQKLLAYLQTKKEVSELELSNNEIVFKLEGEDDKAEELHQELFQHDFKLVEFCEIPLTLEDLYLRLIGSS